MNSKVLVEFGKGVLVVIVGLAVYEKAVKPMINKATISAPTTA